MSHPITIPGTVLFPSLFWATAATDDEPSLPPLSKVCMIAGPSSVHPRHFGTTGREFTAPGGQALTMVATDRYHLHWATIPVTADVGSSWPEHGVLVPAKSLNQALRSWPVNTASRRNMAAVTLTPEFPSDGPRMAVTVTTDDLDRATYQLPMQVTEPDQKGSYPDWRKLVPTLDAQVVAGAGTCMDPKLLDAAGKGSPFKSMMMWTQGPNRPAWVSVATGTHWGDGGGPLNSGLVMPKRVLSEGEVIAMAESTEHDAAQPDPDTLVGVLRVLTQAVADLEREQDASARMEPTAQADLIAVVQDMRHRLGQVEGAATATLGRIAGTIQGNLSDGRQFALKRTPDRKEWDHEDWKRDARRVITERTAARVCVLDEDGLVDMSTGEAVTLARVIQEALAEAQDVHGSSAPKSTSLKRLGLYSGDYCTTSPGGWRLNAIRNDK